MTDDEINELKKYVRCPRCLGGMSALTSTMWHQCQSCNWTQNDDENVVFVDEGIPEGCLLVTDGERL